MVDYLTCGCSSLESLIRSHFEIIRDMIIAMLTHWDILTIKKMLLKMAGRCLRDAFSHALHTVKQHVSLIQVSPRTVCFTSMQEGGDASNLFIGSLSSETTVHLLTACRQWFCYPNPEVLNFRSVTIFRDSLELCKLRFETEQLKSIVFHVGTTSEAGRYSWGQIHLSKHYVVWNYWSW